MSNPDPEWVIECVYAALAEVAPTVPPGLVLSVRMASHSQIMCVLYLSLEGHACAYGLVHICRDGEGVEVRTSNALIPMENRRAANADELGGLLLEALRSNGFRYLAGRLARKSEDVEGEYV